MAARDMNIEIARVASLVGVVTIHAHVLGMFGAATAAGFLADELSRFAVPLFFMLSGYLWKPVVLELPVGFLLRLARRVLVPYFLWVAIYLAVDRSGLLGPATHAGTLKQWVVTLLAGDPGYHLWFLPGLWLGSALALLLIRLAGVGWAFAATAALFVMASFVGAYARRWGVDPPSFVYRNGVGFAAFFILAGYMARGRKPGMAPALAAMILGGAGQVAEGYALVGDYPAGHDFSLSTALYAIGVMAVVLSLPERRESRVGAWGGDVFGAYLVHLLVLMVYAAAIPARGLAPAALCVLISTAVSLILSRLWRRARRTAAPVA
ncbi:MAG: hypothetical protein DI556_16765 [Rhodovulum sulfidophilum]|uniref:Acyltransferase 3 domain-containing protein n=1 Tax=Rhodovulum sulfidophilum TaxID=35806 RepID=A0A2W5PYD6_RHOSU|nr:MAG: hypothetical protein DI556_16765 [Rhodovulum sulfidophilum]